MRCNRQHQIEPEIRLPPAPEIKRKKYGKEYKDVIHVSLFNHIVKILIFEDKKLEKVKKAIENEKSVFYGV